MATKTSILSTINGFITAIVTVLKVRNAFSTIVNEIYPDIISETRTTTSHTSRITTPNGVKTSILYNIFIVKQGRLVTIKGVIWNQTGAIVSNSDINDFIFEIVDYEYLPETSSNITTFPISLGTFVEINSTEKRLYCNQLGSGSLVNFNIQYFTQN